MLNSSVTKSPRQMVLSYRSLRYRGYSDSISTANILLNTPATNGNSIESSLDDTVTGGEVVYKLEHKHYIKTCDPALIADLLLEARFASRSLSREWIDLGLSKLPRRHAHLEKHIKLRIGAALGLRETEIDPDARE